MLCVKSASERFSLFSVQSLSSVESLSSSLSVLESDRVEETSIALFEVPTSDCFGDSTKVLCIGPFNVRESGGFIGGFETISSFTWVCNLGLKMINVKRNKENASEVLREHLRRGKRFLRSSHWLGHH